MEFVVVKKLAKNLEMTTTTITGPPGEFDFKNIYEELELALQVRL